MMGGPSILAYASPHPHPNNNQQTDLAFFDVNKTGELAGRLSTDVHEVAEHLVEVRFFGVAHVLVVVVGCL